MAMDELKHYLQNEYADDKKRIDRINTLLVDVFKSNTFDPTNKTGISYEVPLSLQNVSSGSSEDFSKSTNAMILYVLLRMLNEIDSASTFTPNIQWTRIELEKTELLKIKDASTALYKLFASIKIKKGSSDF
jgi:hypothetical protein